MAAPRWRRSAAVAAQAFALLGTLVGLLTIAVGVGPRTAPDLAYHAAILALLGYGLTTAVRARTSVSSGWRVAVRDGMHRT